MRLTGFILKRTLLLLASTAAAAGAMFYGQNSGVHLPTSTNAKRHPALAFDQIDRLLLRGAAPPEINSFAVDAATITSLPPLKADIHGRGKAIAQGAGNMLISTAVSFIPVAGPFIAGAASRAVNGAEQAAEQREMEKHNAAVAHFISAGALSRFAFYHGWLRSERGQS